LDLDQKREEGIGKGSDLFDLILEFSNKNEKNNFLNDVQRNGIEGI